MKGVWNLSDLYKTNNDFLNDFEKANELLNKQLSFRGKLRLADPEIILEYLKNDTEFSIIIERLVVYAFCKKDDNGKSQQNVKNYSLVCDFLGKLNEQLAFSKIELAEIDDSLLVEMAGNKKFKDYDRLVYAIIRQKAHTLSEKEEILMASVSSFSNSDDIFTMLSNVEMDHGEIIDENGKLIKLTPGNYNLYMNSPTQKVRKNVAETYLGKYKNKVQTFANLLVSHYKYENFFAKTYGYKDVLDEKCYNEEVSAEVMQNCIENVSKYAKLQQKYFIIKKRLLELEEFNSSDISVEISLRKKKKIKYDDAISAIADSFLILGEDYKNMFLKANNEGWIDAFPREGKKSGGYTISAYSSHPFILLNFDGTFEWTSALAHEFGHAMHSYYSSASQPYAKNEYTLFVAEIVSLTNEIIFIRHLLSKTNDKKYQIELISHFLQLFNLNVFNSVMLAEFELYAHNSLWNGETLVAEDLSKKYLDLAKKYYGNSVKFTKNYECGWARNGHLYRDYYLYKYAMGFCAACFVANNIENDNSGEFLKKYKQFLTLGDSLDPISSLKVAGIDVESNKIYDDAFNIYNEYLCKLKNLMEDK